MSGVIRSVFTFAAVMGVVYAVVYAAAWYFGGQQKVGSVDPGMSADQGLAPLIALIYTGVAAATWVVLLVIQRLTRRR